MFVQVHSLCMSRHNIALSDTLRLALHKLTHVAHGVDLFLLSTPHCPQVLKVNEYASKQCQASTQVISFKSFLEYKLGRLTTESSALEVATRC